MNINLCEKLLTEREIDILRQISEGKLLKEIRESGKNRSKALASGFKP